MAQGMRMHGLVDAGACGRLCAGVPDDLVTHGLLDATVPPAPGKQPRLRLVAQAAPTLAESVEQFRTEHDVPVLAAFAAQDVNHHSAGIDIAHLKVRQLGAAEARAVQEHEDGAVDRRCRAVDQTGDLLLAEDGGQFVGLLGVLGSAPG